MAREGGQELIPAGRIDRMIVVIRGHRVMLDSDLAQLYGVTTGNLNKAVRRNPGRFPNDFVFQLTADETRALLFQIGRAKRRGGRQTRPYAFTENGVAMLSSVLNSERAILVNVAIMRTFTRLREILATHRDFARRLKELERKYDESFRVVFDVIRALMQAPPRTRRIGFTSSTSPEKPPPSSTPSQGTMQRRERRHK